MTNKPEIIAIGDVVVDAFIELLPNEAEIDPSPKDHHPLLCMTYGSKLPFKNVTVVPGVGNSPNAAVSFARLGLKAGLASNIGSDIYGHDILATMKKKVYRPSLFISIMVRKPTITMCFGIRMIGLF